MWIIVIICIYFAALMFISRLTQRRADNQTFFRAERRSPWYMVAFGMVGASISGVTFVSVPGMVLSSQMTYLQVCLGFIVGYLVVAFVLLPVYYKLNLTSIYMYLGQRLGRQSYQTGAWFFLLSKMVGATIKFYVVCMVLQQFTVDLAVYTKGWGAYACVYRRVSDIVSFCCLTPYYIYGDASDGFLAH